MEGIHKQKVVVGNVSVGKREWGEEGIRKVTFGSVLS